MEQTIAERLPTETRKLAETGSPNIAALARCYTRFADMDKALGYSGACHHWFSGANGPSRSAEVTAGLILNSLKKPDPQPEPKPVPKPAAEESILMVVCPPAKSEKVQKVLAMFGCEVEAI